MRIVQIASDHTHRHAEQTERSVRHFPVAEVTADHHHRATGRERSPARLPAVAVLNGVEEIALAHLSWKLHDLDDHSEEMHPHAADVVVDDRVRRLRSQSLPQVVSRDVVASHLARQHAMKDERQTLGQFASTRRRQHLHDADDRAEDEILQPMSPSQPFHAALRCLVDESLRDSNIPVTE